MQCAMRAQKSLAGTCSIMQVYAVSFAAGALHMLHHDLMHRSALLLCWKGIDRYCT